MCSKREAIRQMNRLAPLAGWHGTTEDAFREILAALMESADDDAHCERIITAWVRSNRWMPRPSEIEETAEATRRSEPRPTGKSSCRQCKGTGFRPVWVLVTITRHPNGEVKGSELAEIGPQVAHELSKKLVGNESQTVANAVGPCGCNYGRQLYTARMSAEAR